MRKLVLPLAAVLAIGYGVRFSSGADEADKDKGEKITGVLCDEHCAEKFAGKEDAEKAAAKHPASCAAKCVKGGEKVVLFHGKDELKLDEKGQKLAKEYLEKKDAKTKVTVMGERSGDEIHVTSIEAYKPKD